VARLDTVVSLPTGRAGVVAQLDPRWKLAAVSVAVCAALVLHNLPVAMVALVLSLATARAACLPARWFAARTAAALLAIALFALPLPLIVEGPGPVWQAGPLRFSARGAEVGLLLAARALTIVTLTLTLLATTPIESLVKAARALGVPGLVVQVGSMTYRYLFVLSDELQRLRVAVRVRGFRNQASRHAYATVGRVAGSLLVRSHDRAERVHQAMLCRGFDGQFRTLTNFRTRLGDVLAFTIIAGCAVALVAVDRLVL
jgi:cobalt/nickel transport system permease protein